MLRMDQNHCKEGVRNRDLFTIHPEYQDVNQGKLDQFFNNSNSSDEKNEKHGSIK